MRKLGITILLLVYAFVQLVMFGWHFYKPVVHAICYNQLHFRFDSKGKNEFVIKTDLASYRKALQDEDEILWKGERCDIESIVTNGNEITLVVKKDITETNWLETCNKVQQEISKNNPPQSLPDSKCYKWIFKLYMPAEAVTANLFIHPCTPQNSLYLSDHDTLFFPDGPCQPPDTVG